MKPEAYFPKIFTIGIIEDEVTICKEWRTMFEIEDTERKLKKRRLDTCQLDYIANNYDSFIENFKNKDFSTNTILLDLHLGRMQKSGRDILEYLQKHSRLPKDHYKVIVISSYCDDFNLSETERLGASAHIRKSLIAGAKPEFVEGVIHQVWKQDGFLTLLNERAVNQPPIPAITNAQLEIVRLKSVGFSSKQVAKRRLLINDDKANGKPNERSYNTVDAVMSELRRKFKVNTTAELIAKLKDLGVL